MKRLDAEGNPRNDAIGSFSAGGSGGRLLLRIITGIAVDLKVLLPFYLFSRNLIFSYRMLNNDWLFYGVLMKRNLMN